jgi:hypothetical protein
MPPTVSVSVSRKLGLPSFGSVGASCAAQIELDPFVLTEPETLRQRIHDAFDVCRQAVNDELARSGKSCLPAPFSKEDSSDVASPAAVQGELEFASPPLATERQVEFLYQLARQIRGLGGQRLILVAEHRYGRSLNELTASEASGLIDLLKEVRSGARPVCELLPEAAA